MQQSVLSAAFDFIHEHIRLFDDLLHAGRGLGIGDGADTEGDRPAFIGHGLIKLVLNLFQKCGGCISRRLGQQDDKLVAANPGKDVGAPDIRCNRSGDRYQQVIANGMPQAVIDALEIVQVDIGYGYGVLIAL